MVLEGSLGLEGAGVWDRPWRCSRGGDVRGSHESSCVRMPGTQGCGRTPACPPALRHRQRVLGPSRDRLLDRGEQAPLLPAFGGTCAASVLTSQQRAPTFWTRTTEAGSHQIASYPSENVKATDHVT